MNARMLRRAWVCVPVIAVWIAGPRVARGSAEPSLKVAGQVDGITVGKARRNSVDSSQMSVERGRTILAGESGMPLCYGDVISTGSDVTAVLRIGESPDSEKEFTLHPATKIELLEPDSLFLRIGRMFASLRGAFSVKTIFARLGAKGTEFHVEASESAIEVIQLEGSLEFAPPVAGARRYSPIALLFDPLASRAAGFPGDDGAWPLSTSGSAQGAPVRLERLTRLRAGHGQRPRRAAAGRDLVREVVDVNSSAILATRPESPSQNLINVYESRESRALAYREARFNTIWSPERREFFEKLGDVYADWADANKALRAYRAARDLRRKPRQQAVYYNSLGNASRLAGDLKAAESLYRQALDADPKFAFPFNGLGDVQRDRALAAMDEGRPGEARDLLFRAEGLYRRSLDPDLWGKEGGTNRSVPISNLGFVALHRGELSINDAAEAQRHLAEAQRTFQAALQEASDFPFAQVGNGRSYLVLATVLQRQGRKDAAARALSQAQAQLEKTVEQHPSFAVGWQWLGAVSEQQGNRGRAIDQLRRATRLDPQNALAYHRLARALDSENPVLARLYHQTYLHVESPVFKNGTMARLSTSRIEVIAPPDRGLPPEQALLAVPRVIGLDLAAARAQLEGAGLRLGAVDRRAGSQPPETVIEQKPAPGARVPPGTAVDVVIAIREVPPQREVKVPGVVGDAAEKAVRKIRGRGLVEVVRQQPSCTPDGKVLSQEPRKDAKVPEGSAVTIGVAGPGEDAGPVPSVIGLPRADAERALREAGLEVGRTSRRQSSQDQPDTVTKQEPGAGTRLARGCPVRLTVASTPRSFDLEVPDLRGLPLEQARNQLGKGLLGFLTLRLGQVTQRETGAPPGTVVDQDPQPGTRVSPGTAVNVVISGPQGQTGGVQDQQVEVPRVIGQSQDGATAVLARAGLTWNIVFRGSDATAVPSHAPPGTVVDQNPQPGIRVPRGSTVEIGVVAPQVFGRTDARVMLIEVPNVVGRPFAEAAAMLKNLGLSYETVGTGTVVLDQTPKPGTRVGRGTKVSLKLYGPIR